MQVYSMSPDPIGCDADALLAAEGNLSRIGSGLFKVVYQSPDGAVVYKVSRGADLNSNEVTAGREVNMVAEAAWCAYGNAEGTSGIPHVTMYRHGTIVVMAMPYYPLDSYDVDHDVMRAAHDTWHHLGLSDLHADNVRADASGTPFVVDLAGWAEDYPTDSMPREVYTSCLVTCDEPDDTQQCSYCGELMDECYCETVVYKVSRGADLNSDDCETVVNKVPTDYIVTFQFTVVYKVSRVKQCSYCGEVMDDGCCDTCDECGQRGADCECERCRWCSEILPYCNHPTCVQQDRRVPAAGHTAGGCR